jgi:hypothetical protein
MNQIVSTDLLLLGRRLSGIRCLSSFTTYPAKSAEITIAIEEAAFCDGSECGIAAPWVDGELELLAPHCHMIEKGRWPEAGPRRYPIWKASDC